MNIIMLDIDGVIKPFGDTHGLDPNRHELNHKGWPMERVRRIQDICERAAPCGVVISSTWRKISRDHNMPGWWQDQFSQMGFDINVYGVTPKAANGFRGREVNNWLFHNRDVYEVENYVTIDDDSDFYEDQPFYQINGFVGIEDEDVDNIVAWLNDRTPLRAPPCGYHKETTTYDDNTVSLYPEYFS